LNFVWYPRYGEEASMTLKISGQATRARSDARIEKVGRELAEWRRSHRPPTPLPEQLWHQAVELAGEHGAYKVARALRLDYAVLKRRLGKSAWEVPSSNGDSVATFVEVIAPFSGSIGECELEVDAPGGGRMRVVLKNVPASGLATIIRDFVVR
jgi:hypothetical protein